MTIRIFAYNTFLRPRGWFPHRYEAERARRIGPALWQLCSTRGIVLDAVAFCEAFDDGPGADAPRPELISSMRQYVFATDVTHYRPTMVVGTDSGLEQDGGVFAMARVKQENAPLVQDTLTFGELLVGDDRYADKGVLYVRVDATTPTTHLFVTHANANYASIPYAQSRAAREAQFRRIDSFITKKAIPSDELVLLAGDLNVDRVEHAAEHAAMLEILRMKEPRRTNLDVWPFTYDAEKNPYAAIEAPSFDRRRNYDYVLVSARHAMPKAAGVETVPLSSDAAYAHDANGEKPLDLSDHFGVLATIAM